MKQLHKTLITAAIALSLALPAASALAQEGGDLGIQSSGLLPSNPFYFLKEWGRGFRKLLSANPSNRAQLELDALNEKAAEIKKLDEIVAGNIPALERALGSYQDSLDRLRDNLAGIKDELGTPALATLSDDLTARGLRHFRLLEDLADQYALETALVEQIQKAVDGLVGVIGAAPVRLVDPKVFTEQFLAAVNDLNDPFRELRAADLADRLGIAALREDLLLKFSGKLEGLALAGSGLGDLDGISGDRLHRLGLLDEVRENVLNPALRNELNILRQGILDKVGEAGGISEEAAKQALADAQDLLAKAEEMISGRTSVRNSVKDLVERAKFGLQQSEQFLAGGDYGSAFGQATAAQAALKNAINQLTPDASDFSAALENVQKDYDYWLQRVGESSLTKEKNPKLFALLAEAERRIVELAKLIEKESAPESVATSLRTIKILLSTIGEFFNALENPKPVSIPTAPGSNPVKTTSVLQAESVTVFITGTGFEPPIINIAAGAKVTWLNKDIRPHWPVSVSTGFDSAGGLSEGETYSFVFEKAGTWKYQDRLNPGMNGVVEVSE